MQFSKFAFAIVAASLFASPALAQRPDIPPPEPKSEVVETEGGSLRIVQTAGNQHEIYLQGRLLAVDETSVAVGVLKVVNGRFAVLKHETGSANCPAVFRVVAIPPIGTSSISETFGTCSTKVTVTVSPQGFPVIAMPLLKSDDERSWFHDGKDLISGKIRSSR